MRDGDPAALEGLCERRGPAVLAYCRIIAGDAAAADAAAEAFGRFRAAVVAADDPASLNPEALLISATRHAAAHHASVVASGLCAEVPVLLAGRADHSISPANVEFLEGHLEVCWTCRAPVARFAAAERAYRDPPDQPVPPDAAETIVAALAAAAPVRTAADEPVPTGAAARLPATTNGARHHDAPADAPAATDPVDEQLVASETGPADKAPVGDTPGPADRTGRPTTKRRVIDDLGAPARESSSNGQHGPGRARRETGGTLAALGAAIGGRAARAQQAHSARGAAASGRATGEPRLGSGTYLPRPERVTSSVRPMRRERDALRPSVVFPVVLVASALLIALFVAGVFGSTEPASSPTSSAPRPAAPPAGAKKPEIVLVPGAGNASGDAVERAKARARAQGHSQTPTPQHAPAAPATPAAKPPPPPPPPHVASAPPATHATPAPPPAAGPAQPSGGVKAKPVAPRRRTNPKRVDANKGATGAEQLPPAKSTSTVPELAPPAEPALPPPD